MGSIKNENYLHIEGWMINELQLKGNDLLVYAVIYGFSQDGESRFTGSLQYLADWCNGTKQGVQKNLNTLLEKGYIEKFETTKNNIKYCEYSCIPYNSVAYPIQRSCTNTIDNTIDNKDNNISKDILTGDVDNKAYSNSDFLGSRKKPVKTPKKNLYQKCTDEIDLFTNSIELRTMLVNYLEFRISVKDKPIYGVPQWKALLNKLRVLSSNNEETMRILVQQSLDKGWLSFYPVKQYNKRDTFAEGEGLSCEQTVESLEERMKYSEGF